MRKPNVGKQRSISSAVKRVPRLQLPKSATPPVDRPHPKVNKPHSSEIKPK